MVEITIYKCERDALELFVGSKSDGLTETKYNKNTHDAASKLQNLCVSARKSACPRNCQIANLVILLERIESVTEEAVSTRDQEVLNAQMNNDQY